MKYGVTTLNDYQKDDVAPAAGVMCATSGWAIH